MDKCCQTCEWFHEGRCEHDLMKFDLEEIVDAGFRDMKLGVTDPIIRRMLDIVEDAIVERLVEKKFTPPNCEEFYCKYYE